MAIKKKWYSKNKDEDKEDKNIELQAPEEETRERNRTKKEGTPIYEKIFNLNRGDEDD